MATIDPHAFFSSPNHNADPRMPSPASVSAYLKTCDEHHIKLIRVLPKQKKASDPFFLALGLRQTLKALVEYHCEHQQPYDQDAGIVVSLPEVALFNCYTESATKGHLKALAKAGWLSISDSSKPNEAAYKISVALELYAELTQLEATTDGLHGSRCDQLKDQLTALLACNQAEYEALQQSKQRSRLVARGATGAKIIELAIKIAERDRAGLGIAYQLREQIGICLPFLATIPPSTPTPSSSSSISPSPPLPKTSADGGAFEETPITPQPPEPPPPVEEITHKSSSEQRAIKLRNELLSLACHIDKVRLVPEVLAFIRSQPSLAELEEKVRALKLAKRSGHLTTSS